MRWVWYVAFVTGDADMRVPDEEALRRRGAGAARRVAHAPLVVLDEVPPRAYVLPDAAQSTP
jgi:hypothetical protein